MTDLIKQARELCGETYTGDGESARIWLTNKIVNEYPRMMLTLADALEKAQGEIERLREQKQKTCEIGCSICLVHNNMKCPLMKPPEMEEHNDTR